MSFITNLPSITSKSKKRLGRGYGSGKGGHTSGRGQKGQKSRRSIPLLFTGTKNKKSFIQRLPVLRGKSKFKSLKPKPILIPLQELNQFKPHTKVEVNTLVAARLVKGIDAKIRGVKILNQGELTKPLKVHVPVSQSAREKITAAGGSVVA